MKIVAMIPARGGSKGLVDKNIKLLAGKPLIWYSISAARESQYIDKIYFNSENEKYLQIAESYGITPYKRPKHLAEDTSSMRSVVENFVETLIERDEIYDAVIVLYPVYPLRDGSDLDRIIEKFKEIGGKRPLVGMKDPLVHPYLCYKFNENGSISNVMGVDPHVYYRRQQYPDYYQLTFWSCMCPFDRVKDLNSQLLTEDVYGYKIPSDKIHVDIDTEMDFKLAELYLSGKHYGGTARA